MVSSLNKLTESEKEENFEYRRKIQENKVYVEKLQSDLSGAEREYVFLIIVPFFKQKLVLMLLS